MLFLYKKKLISQVIVNKSSDGETKNYSGSPPFPEGAGVYLVMCNPSMNEL